MVKIIIKENKFAFYDYNTKVNGEIPSNISKNGYFSNINDNKCNICIYDAGNIHFGFVDSVLFSVKTLCIGADIYQIYSGTSSWKYWYSFFDDPRDTFCIFIGRAYWRLLFNRRVFQW